MAKYPNRPQFFANKFVRLLTKSAAAMSLGADTCWLLTVIVMQEDSAKYRKPIDYWNEQLMALCGFGGKNRLIKCRSKAIEAGWLKYEPGGKSKPAQYWVTTPPEFNIDADSGSCFEDDLGFQNETANGTGNDSQFRLPSQNGTQNGTPNFLPSQNGTATGRQPDGKGETSIPNPNPNPNRKRFSYSPSFESFWSAFPSGRKSGKRDAFRAWQLVVRDTAPELIIAAAREYASSDVAKGEFVKSPAPWLRAGCWEDDRNAWNRSEKPNTDTARRI